MHDLKKHNQIVFAYENYVNGSVEQIAGICNEDGNVVGMMPHPERAAEKLINPLDNKPSSLICAMLGLMFSKIKTWLCVSIL
jgi:phosphoribosylformylglycinamidine synthase